MGEETSMMSRLVVLKLDGDLETHGFQITLDVAQEEPFSSISFPQLSKDGYLPPNPKLIASLNRWTQDYGDLTGSNQEQQSRALTPYKIQVSGSINPLIEVCKTSSEALATLFKNWLRTDSFRDIEMVLREVIGHQSAVRILIRTQAHVLHLLPWHLWPLIQDYPNAEVAMGAHQFKDERQASLSATPEAKVRILAVLGNDDNIDVGADRRLLNGLPGAQVTLLVKPDLEEFNDQLYENRWDILFFAGHSDTTDGQGVLQLNTDTMLTINQVEYGMRRAIANGLQLAIFNSCNGVGLAYALERLDLPQMIVMRQAVPDHVAHTFLKHFLKVFSRGCSFYQAEREARERLQGLEENFPCASWLPVIYQHPAKIPPSWQQLQGHAVHEHPPQQDTTILKSKSSSHISTIRRVISVSLFSTLAIMGIRWLGFLEPWELKNYDQLFQWRSQELSDSRLLIVGADEEDLRTYDHPLPDRVLTQLIKTLEANQPRAIGLDMYRDQPVPSHTDNQGYEALVSQFQNSSNLVTACTFGSDKIEAIAPPPASPLNQIGFVDLETDTPELTIRRHLSSHKPTASSICNTDYSFTLQLLSRYINNSNGRFSIAVTSKLDWEVNDHRNDQSIIFRRLSSRSGGYQTLDTRGNQILINYRKTSNVARQVSVQDILDGNIRSDWIKDKIVLIGVVAPSIKDSHNTPIGKLRGLQVHAQTLSHYLSAIEDGRPLIHYLPQWADTLVVFGWTAVSGLVLRKINASSTFNNQSLKIGLFAAGLGTVIILTNSLGYLALAYYGLWLPVIPSSLVLVTIGGILVFSHLEKQMGVQMISKKEISNDFG